MSLFKITQNRHETLTVTIYDAAGDLYVWVPNDVIRVKIGRAGQTPNLDLSSKAATSSGSTVSKSNPCSVELARGDTNALKRGLYEFEVAVVDDSAGGKIKHVENHIMLVASSQKGAVTL